MVRKVFLFLTVLFSCSILVNAQKRTLNVGIVNKKAIYLPKPVFPKSCRCKGIVRVKILIDALSGKVVEAQAFSGHPLLRVSAVEAARQARFSPSIYSGQRIIVKGTLVYNFNPNGSVKF
jgi:outer membrane biosynthesis protein TonB